MALKEVVKIETFYSSDEPNHSDVSHTSRFSQFSLDWLGRERTQEGTQSSRNYLADALTQHREAQTQINKALVQRIQRVEERQLQILKTQQDTNALMQAILTKLQEDTAN